MIHRSVVKVLILGGFGFLGKNFIRKYSDQHDIIVYTKRDFIPKVFTQLNLKIEKGGIEENKVIDIINKHRPEVVVHLAALTGLKKCQENPQEAFNVNVYGTFNVIRGCILSGSKLIFLSSREVYGETQKEESSENDLMSPNNLYATTKMLGEILVRHASNKEGLPYTILRATNAYGPENNKGVSPIIKKAIEEKKIQVNGGKQILNLIYVDDLVDLIHLVLDDKRSLNQTFNAGSKDTLSISEFAEKVAKSLEGEIEIQYLPKIELENSTFRPNLEKLKNLLGFTSKTNLGEGIEKTIKWQMNNMNSS